MLSIPTVVYHPERLYAAIEKWVKPMDIGNVLPPLHCRVNAWLVEKGLQPAGVPFFLYLSMQNGEMLVRVGFEVKEDLTSQGDIIIDKFPAGNYAELLYIGDYKHMMQAHMALDAWVKEAGFKEEAPPVADGCVAWGSRAEFYVNDCMEIPNPDEWETLISFLLKE